MKVRLSSSLLPEEVLEYGDFIPGNIYRAIDIEGENLRIMSDDGRPYCFEKKLFEVVEPDIPDDWIDQGNSCICPAEVSRSGFWEDYFEYETELFKVVREYLEGWRSQPICYVENDPEMFNHAWREDYLVRLKRRVDSKYKYPDLIPGNIYRVIGIEGQQYRIMNCEGCPYLYDSKEFEIVDDTEPFSWITVTDKEGMVKKYSEPLLRNGIFDGYKAYSLKAMGEVWAYMQNWTNRASKDKFRRLINWSSYDSLTHYYEKFDLTNERYLINVSNRPLRFALIAKGNRKRLTIKDISVEGIVLALIISNSEKGQEALRLLTEYFQKSNYLFEVKERAGKAVIGIFCGEGFKGIHDMIKIICFNILNYDREKLNFYITKSYND